MGFRVEKRTLQTADAVMDYVTFGSGKKTLLMIQGLNTNGLQGAETLGWMYRIFAKEYRVYLFDRRRELPTDVTVEDLAADTARAMDALGLTGADVIGVSQGGMIAQCLALQRPELVNKLVLAVTLSRSNGTVESVVENWIALTERGDWRALTADMAEKMYSEAYLRRCRPFLPLLSILQKPKDPERFITLARACLSCDTYGRLAELRCPVFVIGGRQDRIVTAEASLEMAEQLGCEWYLYETLGHAAYEEAKDFNRRIYAFLRGEGAC